MEKRRTILYKKAISFFVAALLTVACLPTGFSVFSAVWDGDVDTSWYHAGETELSISNPEELAGLAKLVNGGTNFEGVTITLQADLQMNSLTDWEKWETSEVVPENSWTPIGIFDECIFHGTFDGNHHTISGLYVESTGKKGLFTAIASDATVKNLTLEKSYFGSIDDYAGGICAYNYRGTIQNCHNHVIVSSWYYTAGGICGANYFGVVSQCSNEAFISATVDAGGIAGINFCATITESCNTGKISAKQCSGGIAGEESSGEIQNCYNTGALKGEQAVGGIVGKYNAGSFENCYNVGSVTGTGAIGGIVGSKAASCDNCYYLSEAVADALDADTCTAMKKADMQKASFAEQLGDAYSGVNGSYPLLEWEQRIPVYTETTTTTTAATTTSTSLHTTDTSTETTADTSSTGTTEKTTVTDSIQVVTVNNVREINQIGGTLQLFLLGTTEKPIWLSTDEDIATIDENGLVTAVSEGSVMVGATVNHKFYKLTITINVLETTTKTTTATTTTTKTTTATTTTNKTTSATTTTNKTTSSTTTTPKTTSATTTTAKTTSTTTTSTTASATTTSITTTTLEGTTTTGQTHAAYEKGDVDGNSVINVEDAVAVLTYYAKRSAGMNPIFSELPMQHAKAMIASDIDEDNIISVEDAVSILTYYAKQSAGLNPDWVEIVGTSLRSEAAEESVPEVEINVTKETEALPEEETDLLPEETAAEPIV